MPYIKSEARELFDNFVDLDGISQATVGELNYLITRILMSTNPKSYADYNSLIGCLECCKLELYRRACAVYENKKCLENGDILEYETRR